MKRCNTTIRGCLSGYPLAVSDVTIYRSSKQKFCAKELETLHIFNTADILWRLGSSSNHEIAA